jgi:hypothetical protein
LRDAGDRPREVKGPAVNPDLVDHDDLVTDEVRRSVHDGRRGDPRIVDRR